MSSIDYSSSQQNNEFEDEYNFYLKPSSVDKNMQQYIKNTQQKQQKQQQQQNQNYQNQYQHQQQQQERTPVKQEQQEKYQVEYQLSSPQEQKLTISQLKPEQKEKDVEELQEMSVSDDYDQQAQQVLHNLKQRVTKTISNKQSTRLQDQKTKKQQQPKKLTTEDKEVQKYSFKPQINNQYQIKKRIRYDDYKSYYDQQRQKREEMYQKQLDKEIKECTFKPKINNYSSKLYNSQKQTKLSQVQLENKLLQKTIQRQQQNDKMETSQAKYIEQQEEIRRKAYRDMLAQKYMERVNPDLVFLPPEDRLNYINKQQHEDDESQYTFQPKINKSSEILASRRGQDIVQRTQYYQTQKMKRIQELEDELYPQQEHTVINQSTIDRLSKQKTKVQKIEEQPTFQPQINQLSSKLTQNRISIFNDYDNYIEQANRTKVQLQQYKQDKECTFKPQISQLAQHTQSIFDQNNINNLMQNINSKEQQKQQMIEYQKQQEMKQQDEKLQEEAKNFKSQPVNKKLFEPVYVNGYDKVIERKKKIDQLKEEQEERKKRVYGENIKPLEELNQQPFVEFQITRRQRVKDEQKLLSKDNKTVLSPLLDELLY